MHFLFNFKKAKVWINKLKQQLKGEMFIEPISSVNGVLFLHHTDISVREITQLFFVMFLT